MQDEPDGFCQAIQVEIVQFLRHFARPIEITALNKLKKSASDIYTFCLCLRFDVTYLLYLNFIVDLIF